jgi:DnaK suppressor protein
MLVLTREEDSAEAADTSSWSTFRISLKGERSELVSELQHLPPSTSNEALDFPSVARRRFLERKVEDIDEALARILDGTYGACRACGMAIPTATLTAEPAASHCEICVTPRRADRPRAA